MDPNELCFLEYVTSFAYLHQRGVIRIPHTKVGHERTHKRDIELTVSNSLAKNSDYPLHPSTVIHIHIIHLCFLQEFLE